MIVFLNGEFVPEERAHVSVFDRGFTYGDGVFEVIRVSNGKLFRWGAHFERLKVAAEFLKIALPRHVETLPDNVRELIARNNVREGMVRIELTRGVGQRGYAPTGNEYPTLVATTHPLAVAKTGPVSLIVSSFRVPAGNTLTQHKTTNRLVNVLSAIEAKEQGADDALIVDTDGHVTEAVASNVFWIKGDTIFTAPVAAGLLPGITRGIVFELCGKLATRVEEQLATVDQIASSDGVFLSLSSRGIISVGAIEARTLPRPEIIERLGVAYEELLHTECR